MPISPTALFDCLNCYIELLVNPICEGDDDVEATIPPSLATRRVLLNLLDELHPDTWGYDGTAEEVSEEHITFCKDICMTYLVPKQALEWIENERLNDYDPKSPDPYEANIWRLPPPAEIPLDLADQLPSVNDWGEFYASKDAFLKDVDWMQVKRIMEASYEDSIDPVEVKRCRDMQVDRI